MGQIVTGKQLAEELGVARSTLSEATREGWSCAGHPVADWAQRAGGRTVGYELPDDVELPAQAGAAVSELSPELREKRERVLSARRRERAEKEQMWPPAGEKRVYEGRTCTSLLCTRENGEKYEVLGVPTDLTTGDHELLPDYDARENPNEPESVSERSGGPNDDYSVPPERALIPVEDDDPGERESGFSWGAALMAFGTLGAAAWMHTERTT